MEDSKFPVMIYRVLMDILLAGRSKNLVSQDNEWEDLILDELDKYWALMSPAERSGVESVLSKSGDPYGQF